MYFKVSIFFVIAATAYYRMLPEIKLLREVTGKDAKLLKKCFSPGVIEVEEGSDGVKRAVVADARYDTCSRIVYRYPELKDCVQIARIRDHFICEFSCRMCHVIFHFFPLTFFCMFLSVNIESVGALPPHEIFLEAVKILQSKCQKYLKELHTEDYQ